MTKAGDRIVMGLREAIDHARMTRDDLPSDAAIAEALRLSGVNYWPVNIIKEVRRNGSLHSRAIIAFARYIQENPRS